MTLSKLNKNDIAIINKIDESLLENRIDLEYGELERRLIEMGIMENIKVKVLHFGLINKDPIAIRLEDTGVIVAIRRNEANTILVNKI
ncbi:MAG: ferrous iron transport protein A [Neisseriaceae bacterium]|nr:MAG: ferrous iron transport protein A [Neisseriaceae bacterium]